VTSESWQIRVASSPEFGGGHVKRCFVLASAMAPFASVRFVLDRRGEAWSADVSAAGYAVSLYGDEPSAPVDGVVLDHYDPAVANASRWRGIARRVVALRDGGQPIPNADLEIYPWAPREDGAADRSLRGLDYALVDPVYVAIPDAPIEPLPAHVLVAFGYRDSPDATSRVLNALARLGARWAPKVTVVLGAHAPNLRRVEAACDKLGERARLVLEPPGLQDLLSDCDFAIGAGGVSAMERAGAGRPSLTIALNALQVPAARALAQAGATADAGLLASLSDAKLDEALMSLASDTDARVSMARAARRTIDGGGAERIARRLFQEAPVGG